MKRILAVDDEPARHDLIAAQHPKDEVVRAFSVGQARQALRTRRYDVVYLDHDLQNRPDPDGRLETGEDVARFLDLHVDPAHRPDEVVIHSTNEAGAAAIAHALKGVVKKVTLRPLPHPDPTRADRSRS